MIRTKPCQSRVNLRGHPFSFALYHVITISTESLELITTDQINFSLWCLTCSVHFVLYAYA